MKVFEVIIPHITLVVEDTRDEHSALEAALEYLAELYQQSDAAQKIEELSEHGIQITLIEDEEEE